MRTLTLALAVLAVTSSTAAARPVLDIAHRGASGHAPEHTFAAYDLALKMGADYIEQDLQQTRDQELVVIHDETLDRTTNCRGLVSTKTVAQIKECAPQVRTLRELFERYQKRVKYYIEIKQPDDAPGMERSLLDLLDEFELRTQVIVESFSELSLQKIHETDSELTLVQLVHKGHHSRAIRERLKDYKRYAIGIAPERHSIDLTLVQAAHDEGMVVHPFTVNDVAEMKRMVDVGVDGMFTDFPDRLYRVLHPAAQ